MQGNPMRCWSFVLTFLGCAALIAQDLEQIGQQSPVQFNAGVQAQFGFYHVDGIDPRRTPYFWSISGTPTATVKGIQLPFMVVLSDQQRSFQQPFNQFGMSPYYKWVKVHLGYRDVSFSKFTLAGYRTLMAGVELNPGKFRFGFIYGRFRKAVAEDTTAMYDPAKYISDVPVAAYKRMGYAVKVGVGTEDQHVDLVLLRASDDAGSIPKPVSTNLAPAENLVVGLVGKVKLSEALRWDFDLAGSAFTRDARSDELLEDGGVITNAVNSFFVPRTSTQGLMAVETGLALKRKRARYKLVYRRVDPDYKSMGAYYFQTDVEQLTGTVTSSLFMNRLSTNLTLGWQHNNLKKLRTATARRIIGNLGLNYTSKKAFGFLVNYTNFGITQTPVRPSLNDTALLEQVSQNLLVQPRARFTVGNGGHMITYTFNYFALSDRSDNAFSNAQLTGMHNDLAYTRNWKRAQAHLGGGLIFRNTESLIGKTISKGVHLEAGRSWLKEGRLSAELRSNFLANTLPAGGDGSTWQLNLQVKMQAGRRFAFTLTLSHQDNASDDPTIPSFTEDTGLIGVDIRF
ncbi:MAG: hypothetical protein IPL81_08885 [Flavobacteriales bacterium]|nr:hypothetical protein [Flavobacteriales bacterium]MBK9059964.1 hypothetical protein [Flavobacteriales bacterium]QQS71960.1 MAG: hypothetical protein IPP95_12335 [Flavobacteriales bacterium]HQV37747.1 hypothetical protein [Flavobacteriales bacterium]HQW30883.1 hypothetical protein [Flavobacteriales bacterium]